MRYFDKSRPLVRILILWWLSHASLCFAIDNPEAPDVVSGFETRSEKFELVVREQVRTQDIVLAYARYEQFLDHELNQAYLALKSQVNEARKKDLARSQRRWMQFRDAEFRFIAGNWTAENFGTSSALSRGAYRTTIIKNRVVSLLHYLKNYR